MHAQTTDARRPNHVSGHADYLMPAPPNITYTCLSGACALCKCMSVHRRSQDFVWGGGALFLTKKCNDLFLVISLSLTWSYV